MALPDHRNEKKLHAAGLRYVAGVDEAGRGPLAGPVVAAAVIFDPPKKIKGLKNSKLLTPNFREEICCEILSSSKSIGIGIVGERVIDEINILLATLLAMRIAVSKLSVVPHHILVDGIHKIRSTDIPQTTIIEGDNISASIAAASVIAKVTRDRIMRGLDILIPGYNFSAHKGYGTEEHLKRINELGPSVAHRRSFEPVRQGVKIEDLSPDMPDAKECQVDLMAVKKKGYRAMCATRAFKPEEIVFPVVGASFDKPTAHTIQVAKDRHILSVYGKDVNHSCFPNCRFDSKHLVFRALGAIEAGEEVTFDYNTTEYELFRPFKCLCGASGCLKHIRGYKYLTARQRCLLHPLTANHLRSAKKDSL